MDSQLFVGTDPMAVAEVAIISFALTSSEVLLLAGVLPSYPRISLALFWRRQTHYWSLLLESRSLPSPSLWQQ